MAVPNNISIRFEKGVFHVSAEIPVAGAREAIDLFAGELSLQILGEEQAGGSRPVKIAPRMLNERDAAKYIGRSVSFLRTCRYKAKRGGMDPGPKYVRYSNKLIFYPVEELDGWLSRNRLFSTCLEEKIYAGSGGIVKFPVPVSEDGVAEDA
jgi:hypothetical protein